MTLLFTRWIKIFKYAMAYMAHPLGTPLSPPPAAATSSAAPTASPTSASAAASRPRDWLDAGILLCCHLNNAGSCRSISSGLPLVSVFQCSLCILLWMGRRNQLCFFFLMSGLDSWISYCLSNKDPCSTHRHRSCAISSRAQSRCISKKSARSKFAQ